MANGIDNANKKRAILLSACGTSMYKPLKTLVVPAELTTKELEELVQLAKDHYTPPSDITPSVITCHFKFSSAFMRKGSQSVHLSLVYVISQPPVCMESQPQS